MIPDLNELLAQYPDPDEAAQMLADETGMELVVARAMIAIAIGQSDGDLMKQSAPGSSKNEPLFPLDKEGKQ